MELNFDVNLEKNYKIQLIFIHLLLIMDVLILFENLKKSNFQFYFQNYFLFGVIIINFLNFLNFDF
jgi:hypothetical protein